uniref:LOW QUALITY PROTEIN: SCL-interrupting locus protein homolog n=1 Tax=Myxine glutinosa TaxID=7769 RepID=UPI00358FD79B
MRCSEIPASDALNVAVGLKGMPRGTERLAECGTKKTQYKQYQDPGLLNFSFPKTNAALWDSKPLGKGSELRLSSHRNPQIRIVEKVLRLANGHAVQSGVKCLSCFLIGSVVVDDDGGLTLILDRFDPGRAVPGQEIPVPTVLLPGDLLVPLLVVVGASDSVTSTALNMEGLRSILTTLHQHCIFPQSTEPSRFLSLIIRLTCNSGISQTSLLDSLCHGLHASFVCVGASLVATPVQPVPVIPTALARNLGSTYNLAQSRGAVKSGFLTMDQTRKLLLLLDSDPKTTTLPLVGTWVSGTTTVTNPHVWACCLRFIHSSVLKHRVRLETKAFLLVLFPLMHRQPEFYECRPGNDRGLDFELFSCSETVSIMKGIDTPGKKPLLLDLKPDHQSTDWNIMKQVLSSNPFEVSGEAVAAVNSPGQRSLTSDNDSGVEEEDLSPRPLPSPHPNTQQACSDPFGNILVKKKKCSCVEICTINCFSHVYLMDALHSPQRYSLPCQNYRLCWTLAQHRHHYQAILPILLSRAATPAFSHPHHHNTNTTTRPVENFPGVGDLMHPMVMLPSQHSPELRSTLENIPTAQPACTASRLTVHTSASSRYHVSPSGHAMPNSTLPLLPILQPQHTLESPQHLKGSLGCTCSRDMCPQSPQSPCAGCATPSHPNCNCSNPTCQHYARSSVHYPGGPISSPPRVTMPWCPISATQCITMPTPNTYCGHCKPPMTDHVTGLPSLPTVPCTASSTTDAECLQRGHTSCSSDLKPDAYQKLREQEWQLQVLQTQIQQLLAEQKKMRSAAEPTHTSKEEPGNKPGGAVVCEKVSIAVGTGASLFWGGSKQPVDRSKGSFGSSNEVAGHSWIKDYVPVSTGQDNKGYTCVSLASSPHAIDIPIHSESCSGMENSSLESSPNSSAQDSSHSPALGASASSCWGYAEQGATAVPSNAGVKEKEDQEKNQYYDNMLLQVQTMLQVSMDEPTQQNPIDDHCSANIDVKRTGETVSHQTQRKSSQCRDVAAATMKQLRKMGVKLDLDTSPTEHRPDEVNRTSSTTAHMVGPSGAVLPGLRARSLSELSCLSGHHASDLSMEANAIALKYLSAAELAELAQCSVQHSDVQTVPQLPIWHPTSSSLGLFSTSNMSFATRRYMRKYGLLDGDDETFEEEEEEEDDEQDEDDIKIKDALDVGKSEARSHLSRSPPQDHRHAINVPHGCSSNAQGLSKHARCGETEWRRASKTHGMTLGDRDLVGRKECSEPTMQTTSTGFKAETDFPHDPQHRESGRAAPVMVVDMEAGGCHASQAESEMTVSHVLNLDRLRRLPKLF